MPARRARRATSRQVSSYKAAAQKGIAREIKKDVDKALARGMQEFAVLSMNELAQRGPAWSGEFSASWGFAKEGETPNTPGTTGKVYKYTKNDVPVYYVERLIKQGVTAFHIVNTSDHANEAIDGETANFRRPGLDPVKEQGLELGTDRNNPSIRFQIGAEFNGSLEDAPAARTAEPDWYLTYLLGGPLKKDFDRGISIGFKEIFR